eukprot:139924_1
MSSGEGQQTNEHSTIWVTYSSLSERALRMASLPTMSQARQVTQYDPSVSSDHCLQLSRLETELQKLSEQRAHLQRVLKLTRGQRSNVRSDHFMLHHSVDEVVRDALILSQDQMRTQKRQRISSTSTATNVVGFELLCPEIHTLCANLKSMLTHNQRVESVRLSLGERQLCAHEACLCLAQRTIIHRMQSIIMPLAVVELREMKEILRTSPIDLTNENSDSEEKHSNYSSSDSEDDNIIMEDCEDGGDKVMEFCPGPWLSRLHAAFSSHTKICKCLRVAMKLAQLVPPSDSELTRILARRDALRSTVATTTTSQGGHLQCSQGGHLQCSDSGDVMREWLLEMEGTLLDAVETRVCCLSPTSRPAEFTSPLAFTPVHIGNRALTFKCAARACAGTELADATFADNLLKFVDDSPDSAPCARFLTEEPVLRASSHAPSPPVELKRKRSGRLSGNRKASFSSSNKCTGHSASCKIPRTDLSTNCSSRVFDELQQRIALK